MVAAYAFDTIVVDVDELDEVTVQVLHEGEWHRRDPDLRSTACGLPLRHSGFASVRPLELSHRDAPLARACGCHTKHELAKADEKWSAR